MSATLFDIQKFSLHDGPGIRTVLFFKGCSLRCDWCQNPESIKPAVEVTFTPDKCVECGTCAKSCPEGAIVPAGEGRIDRDRCTDCGLCVETCPSTALRRVGEGHDVGTLLEAGLEDVAFDEGSGGGITLSGGEPVLQSAFLREFLPAAKGKGLNVLLETAGNYPWRLLEPLLPWIDHIYFDWKLPDGESYRRHTGVDDGRIVENLGELVSLGFPVTVRMPVIPGRNDRPEQVRKTARRLRELGIGELTLLRYNHRWEAKLPRLDTRQKALGISESDTRDGLAELFREEGVNARW